eukprot:746470-Hanusia_phi.AAC.4
MSHWTTRLHFADPIGVALHVLLLHESVRPLAPASKLSPQASSSASCYRGCVHPCSHTILSALCDLAFCEIREEVRDEWRGSDKGDERQKKTLGLNQPEVGRSRMEEPSMVPRAGSK